MGVACVRGLGLPIFQCVCVCVMFLSCESCAGIEPAWFLAFSFLPDFFQSVIKLNQEMVSLFVRYGETSEVVSFNYACYFHGL